MAEQHLMQHQRPEGALIAKARKALPLSGNKAAAKAGLSSARWRQIENGYHLAGVDHPVEVIGPPDTVARMAAVVGVTAQQLRDAGRGDAAEILEVLDSPETDARLERDASPLRRLLSIRDEIDTVIEQLRRGPST